MSGMPSRLACELIWGVEEGRKWFRLFRAAARLHPDQAPARLRCTPKRRRPSCRATTRQGPPCQAPAVWDTTRERARNGRCRMHGGLSTGPRTAEGRARIAASNRRRHQATRERRGQP